MTETTTYEQRLEAFKRGELIDRPIVSIQCVPPGVAGWFDMGYYHDRLSGDMEANIRLQLDSQRKIRRMGDAGPGAVSLSLGPDECAAFCGAEIAWSDHSTDTNWSIPFVEDWADVMPLRIDPDNGYWRRSLSLYRLAGEMVPKDWRISMPDLHSNMDLLAAMRDPLRLCIDMMENPELMDRLFEQTIDVVRTIHDTLAAACIRPRLPATLQSDFCCLVSPEMFRRWIAPALEAEAEIVGESVFHWDGPEAVKHLDDIAAIAGIYAVAYVPGAGHGSHVDHVDLYRKVQSKRMGVCVSGSADEVKWMHRQLDPARTIYHCGVSDPAEGEALLDWFARNT